VTLKVGFDEKTDWVKAKIALGYGPRILTETRRAILRELQILRKIIVDEFRNEGYVGGKWPALSPTTIAIRRFEGFKGTKIMQVTRDLVGSISVVEVPGEGAFVGVARSKSRKDGQDPVNIAKAMEEGFSSRQTMTARQRRYLMAALSAAGLEPPAGRAPVAGGSGATTIVIRVPPRPFLGPVFDEFAKPEDLELSIASRVTEALGGLLGTTGKKPRS
jgi:hypothetical protein